MEIEFALSNFKGFKQTEPIQLKPLTVLCGINNSGKSSILQSLLLMKQSCVDEIQTSIDMPPPLIFNGNYVNLGEWNDAIYKHLASEKMGFSWRLAGELSSFPFLKIVNQEIEVQVDIQLESDKNYENSLTISSFIFRDSRENFMFELVKSEDSSTYNLRLDGFCLLDFLVEWSVYYSRFHQYQYSNRLVKEISANLNKIDEIVGDFHLDESLQDIASTPIEKIAYKNLKVKFIGVFPVDLRANNLLEQNKVILDTVRQRFKGLKSLEEFIEIIINSLNDDCQGIDDYQVKNIINLRNRTFSIDIFDRYSYRPVPMYFRSFWSSLRYLAPIREAPKRFYLFDNPRKIDIGIRGENTPLILALEQNHKIPQYYRCIYEAKRIKEYELIESDLMLTAVNWWLSECMQLPEIKSAPSFKGAINQVQLESSGIPVYLPDVGFGVSQILPIIVECLRSPAGETIILEQPEIHLHPSLQSKLADFLICMAKSGKNLVVETHSEHLINRLCLRIAQEESNAIKDLTNILFVSFDKDRECSIITPIVINDFGEIENWPVGFFDENDSRELIAATLKKRRNHSSK